MDNATQRRRGGRTAKTTQQQGQSSDASSTNSTENILNSRESSNALREKEHQSSKIMDETLNIIDGSAISISPTSDSPCDSALASTSATAAECRRSSRKKIIKFDVRDLLNKNRKPHKIQIEARIDSNAPASTVTTTGSGSASITSNLGSVSSTTDLTSKQKTFIEKSAIFRRYSISEQQSKINAPPPPRPLPPPVSKISLLSKNIDLAPNDGGKDNSSAAIQLPIDPIKMAQARRLSRTQEIFNASMMKSKQNSSLIVAQMESSCSRQITSTITPKRKSVMAKPQLASSIAGNKKSYENKTSSTLPATISNTMAQKRRGRPPKSKTIEDSQQPDADSNKPNLSKSVKITDEEKLSSEVASSKLTPEKATNWKEYKECLKAKEKIGDEVDKSLVTPPAADVILEISSSSDSELEELRSHASDSSSSVKEANKSPTIQRNFASVSFMQETSVRVSDNKTVAPEFIVAAVEEILTDCAGVAESYESTIITPSSKNDENSDLKDSFVELTTVPRQEAPIMERKSTSRTSSSSESDANSDRSNKSYKLRVSLKRLSAQELSPGKETTRITPSSPTNSVSSTTSSTRNSFSENSATSSKDTGEVPIKQTKKRSRRLQMKSEQASVASISTASEAEGEEKVTKIKDDFLPVGLKRTRDLTKTSKVSKVQQVVDKAHNNSMNDKELKELEVTTSNSKPKTNNEGQSKKTSHISEIILAEYETKAETKNDKILDPEKLKECGISEIIAVEINKNSTQVVLSEKDKELVVVETKEHTKTPLQEAPKNEFVSIPKSRTSKTVKTTKCLKINEADSDPSAEQADAFPQNNEETEIKSISKLESQIENEEIIAFSAKRINLISEVVPQSSNFKDVKAQISLTKPHKQAEPTTDVKEVKSCSEFKEEEKVKTSSTTEIQSETEVKKQQISAINENFVDPVQSERKSKTPPKRKKLKIIDDTKCDFQVVSAEELVNPNFGKIDQISTVDVAQETPIEKDRLSCTLKEQDKIAETAPPDNCATNVLIEQVEQNKIMHENELKLVKISKITENVSVETKTLLDILKTVQTIEKAAAAAATINEDSETPSTKISSSSKKRNSPTRSGSSSPQEIKKPVRRYERRSKRGEETTHMTLEETFAEIAAQSSKQILEMAAALDTKPDDDAEKKEETNKTPTETDSITLNQKVDTDLLDETFKQKNTEIVAVIGEKNLDPKENQMDIKSRTQEQQKQEQMFAESKTEQCAEIVDTQNTSQKEQLQDDSKSQQEKLQDYSKSHQEELQDDGKSQQKVLQGDSKSRKEELQDDKKNQQEKFQDDSKSQQETLQDKSESQQEKLQDDSKSQQETLQDESKSETNFPTKRRRKPKSKQHENNAAIEIVTVECHLLSENQLEEKSKSEEKSETDKEKIFEAMLFENEDIEKDNEKTKKSDEQLRSNVERKEASESIAAKDCSTITTAMEFETVADVKAGVTEATTHLESDSKQNEIKVNTRDVDVEKANIIDIQKKKSKKTEKLLEKKEESVVAEKPVEGNIELTSDKLKVQEISPKSDDLVETKDKKSKKPEKVKKCTEIKVSENPEILQQSASILNKICSDDVERKSSPAHELTEKEKGAKTSRKAEDLSKGKDAKIIEDLAITLKSPKLKKAGQLKREESKTFENSKNTQENLNKKLEDTLNPEPNELKGTGTAPKASKENLDTAKKTDVTPKNPQATLNKKLEDTVNPETNELKGTGTAPKASKENLDTAKKTDVTPKNPQTALHKKLDDTLNPETIELKGTGTAPKASKENLDTAKKCDITPKNLQATLNKKLEDSLNPEKIELKGTGTTPKASKENLDAAKKTDITPKISEDSIKTILNEKAKSADKAGSAPKQPPKKRLFKTKSDTELIKATAVESLSSSTEKSQMNETKEPLKKSKNKLKAKDSSLKTKTDKIVAKQEEDTASLTSNKNTPKRGGKYKRDQADVNVDTFVSTSSGKKKGNKFVENTQKSIKTSPKPLDKKQEKSSATKLEKKKFLETENNADKVYKTKEEKSAKKKRQKKLKEAFEAALNEESNSLNASMSPKLSEPAQQNTKDTKPDDIISEYQSTSIHNLPLTPVNLDSSAPKTLGQESPRQREVTQTTIAPPEEEDPDPLKDIEKFIEDGVNLLKRGYKIEDDDSIDEVLRAPSKSLKEDIDNQLILPNTNESDDKNSYPTKVNDDRPPVLSEITSFADTPADTPIATPTDSPSKSPILDTMLDDSYASGVRRSHRIKQIKTPTALVGRGLVRDKERFSGKDDVETKTHYTIDDHRMDLAEVEAKNAKFLKDMEERLSNFLLIKENEYKCERIISKEARKMICDCFLTAEEEGRGELACGEDCLNRLLMIECGTECNVKDRCTNKRFQKFLCSPCRVFRTEKKGFGIMADIEILPGEFIMEYVGEVINGEEFENRRFMYSQDKNRHYYFMALRSDAIIDATSKGNISRFINHSCDPNAETQKWTVNGELRIGFFSRKSIMPGEEITFDYQYQRYGREAQRCYCESANCRGWIGEEPTSDEGEQIVDESDDENLAETLLGDDDDEDDSDETEDAEEAQKILEIAAAEAKLIPITDEDKNNASEKSVIDEAQKKEYLTGSTLETDGQKENVEDSKSKFKKLLSKMAEKVAKKKEQKERIQRKQRAAIADSKKHVKPRYLEDPDIDDEVNFLSRCGLKNQSDTLRLSRLMVRAKLVQTRLNLLKILRAGDLPCRRLFMDYHGLRLLHGWMSEDGGDLKIRMALLETLETLPIANKTMLTDSKVLQTVRNWCGGFLSGSTGDNSSPSDESSKESTSGSSIPTPVTLQEIPVELQKLATKLTTAWESLPEIFRIPKKERIEQMKEHEREADRQYAAIAAQEEESRRNTAFPDRYQRDRFGRSGPQGSNYANRFAWSRGGTAGVKDQRNASASNSSSANDPRRRSGNESATQQAAEGTKHLSKEQRREMFAAKVARDEAEKRLAEERREFETKCRFFGLDPKKTRPQNLPFCVNPTTGQWYSTERQPIDTPPTYAHVQVPVKPKSTNPIDYQIPSCAMNLPNKWKFAITPEGKIYYYHVQFRVPQWEPPTAEQIYGSMGAGGTDTNGSNSDTDADVNDSTDNDDEIIKGMDAAQLQAYAEKKIEIRRQQRYSRLVDERPISPRREEDRIYNQIEVRKYKENKEKIRKRKEEIRRKRVEAVKNSTLNMCTLGSLDEPNSSEILHKKHGRNDESGISNVLPIQDYLLSSDEEEMMKAECNNSPLLEKIVQGDKIVDELDALTTKRPLKRPLPPHRDLSASTTLSTASTSSGISVGTTDKHEHKKRKMDKRESSRSGRKSKDHDSKYRKLKEKFRCEIAGIIVHYLKPYRKDSCVLGRIKTNADFNHLARKLTHFVMIKELKYCESVGQTLVVTESVKNKSREFIKKYMAKYGDEYIKPTNDPEFKDIPFNL